MSILQVIILAVVQGLTEFLPVSSSAHLALAPWLFGWEDPGLAFDIAHLLAGGLVLVSFLMLYQDRMYALINVFALHAFLLDPNTLELRRIAGGGGGSCTRPAYEPPAAVARLACPGDTAPDRR